MGGSPLFLVAHCGIRQFLDIGTGIPSASNTHEVAQAIAPETRIVYGVARTPSAQTLSRRRMSHLSGRGPGADRTRTSGDGT
jgi:hypothetical protein